MSNITRQAAKVTSTVVDNSTIVPSLSYYAFAVVTASKGPLNVPTLISTGGQYIATFGEPSGNHLQGAGAYKIINSGIPVWVCRVADGTSAAAQVVCPGAGSGSATCETTFIAKETGTYANTYRIVVSAAVGTEFTIGVFDGDVPLGTYRVSNDPSASNYLFTMSFNEFFVEHGDGEYYNVTPNDYSFAGGADGCGEGGTNSLQAIQINAGIDKFDSVGIDGMMWPMLGNVNKESIARAYLIAESKKCVQVIVDTPDTTSVDEAIAWKNGTGTYAETGALGGYQYECYFPWAIDNVFGISNIPPSVYVTIKSLSSYQGNGTYVPVAGYKRGIISASKVTKELTVTEQDKLIQDAINPIITSTSGCVIWGNETLNGASSDLSMSHVARTLGYINKRIDDFTKTLLFEPNDQFLWSQWRAYANQVLEVIKAGRGLNWYKASMGVPETMSAEDIANRKCYGKIELQFTPDAEVFALTYTVHGATEELE